ncbi:MAG TPA: glycosyltransferase family 39 protein [Candidatus Nanoarchaeia archaeon]|nr:glycosyltransferase family 39 protein [Candidatus Nanoarchaeia archaeon]
MKKFNESKLEIYLLIAIILFGAFLRFYSLSSAPLWVDESISIESASRILQTGTPTYESGMVDSRAYVFHYIQSFFMLFGNGEGFARLVSVLFGILTILLVYKLGKEYSKYGGLISALFLAVFYLEVFFSRHARMYQMFQFLFFLSIYLLYKSKENIRYLYFALASLVVCFDTQIAALVLCPFFILHIWKYNKKQRFLSIIPLLLIISKFLPSSSLVTENPDSISNYAFSYLGYAGNIIFLLVLAILGAVWAFSRNYSLTGYILVPSIILLFGVFSLETFALRYAYFFVFPIILYSSLLLSFLYERYGGIIILAIVLLLLLPSNLFYPQTYSNVIYPVTYQFADSSAPYTDYKTVPMQLKEEIRNSTLISLFSLDVQYYIKKPDYVIPFSMNGLGEDQISYNSTKGTVDRYSGAAILNYSSLPNKPFFVVADAFSLSKLKPTQTELFLNLTENCTERYIRPDLGIVECQ